MKVVDRYIIKELLPTFLLGLFLFTFVMLANAIIRSIDLFINKGVGLDAILRFLALSLPYILVLTIPMSVLLSILMSFGRLSSDSEIVALKASGFSVHRLLMPALFFAVLCWGITTFIFLYALPWSNHALKTFQIELARSRINVGIKPRIFNNDYENVILYVDDISPDSIYLKKVFLYDQRDPTQPQVILAKLAQKMYENTTGRIILKLNDGSKHQIPRDDPHRYIIDTFKVQEITLFDDVVQAINVPKGDREMTISELLDVAKQNEAQNRPSSPQWVEIHKKFSIPFACIIFALVGVPLGITSHRGGRSSGFAISIIFIIIYYIFLTSGEGLGDKGKMPPWLAMWAPNIVLGAVGLYLLYKSSLEKPFKFLNSLYFLIISLFQELISFFNSKIKKATSNISLPDLNYSFKPEPRFGFPRILDRYVGREFLKIFCGVLAFMVTLSFIVHFFEKIDNLIEHNAKIIDAAKYFFYQGIFFAFFDIHFAVLVGTVLVLGVFSRYNELIAMKATGVSIRRATLMIVFLSFVISGITFFFNEKIIPITRQRARDIYDVNIRKRPPRSVFANNRRWFKGQGQKIYYYRSFNPRENAMSGFSLFEFNRDMTLIKRIEAKKMVWEENLLATPSELQADLNSAERGVKTLGRWRYFDCREILFDNSGAIISDQTYPELISDITETPADFKKEIKDSEEMNYFELRNYITSLEASGYDATPFKVDLQAKFSLPLISFVMSMIGIPFAVRGVRKGGTMVGVGIALFIAASYTIIVRIFMEYGHGGKLSPFLSAWGGNILFVIIALYLIFKTRT